MKRTLVNSGQIKSIGLEDGVMQVEFAKSGRVYEYRGPAVEDHYRGLMAAHENGESVGRYFNRFVRGCPDTMCSELKQSTSDHTQTPPSEPDDGP